MELFEALTRRRTTRILSPRPVPEELVDRLVAAALRAPTASNVPYRHLVVVDHPGTIAAIRRLHAALLSDPPLLLLVVTDRELAERRIGPVAERVCPIDSGAAGENVLLAATALGLAAQFTVISAMAGIRRLIGLPERCWVDLVIPIGWPGGADRPARSPHPGGMVHRNSFATRL